MFESIKERAIRLRMFAVYRCGHREEVASGGPLPAGLHEGCLGGLNERGILRVEKVWPKRRSVRLATPVRALPLALLAALSLSLASPCGGVDLGSVGRGRRMASGGGGVIAQRLRYPK